MPDRPWLQARGMATGAERMSGFSVPASSAMRTGARNAGWKRFSTGHEKNAIFNLYLLDRVSNIDYQYAETKVPAK
ncbi:MAG: hypothetical protein KDJ87_02800 [Rhizobiaceae bacterium]|nr:hypothetical protein [Rhizobiaceae bacterium]